MIGRGEEKGRVKRKEEERRIGEKMGREGERGRRRGKRE